MDKAKYIEVVERKVGYWTALKNRDKTDIMYEDWFGPLYECSICEGVMMGDANFCPWCGARMKEDD